jgi:N-acetylglutamate synthase
VPLPVMSALDDLLAGDGWSSYDLTHVMTSGIDGLLGATQERADLPPVGFEPEVTADWLALYHYRGRDLPAVAPRVLARADLPVFASVRMDGLGVAIARGALARGWIGVTALEVLSTVRRRGLGSHLMRALAAWARERGAHSIYLQVDTANEVAIAFYERLGFHHHHQYHYRVAPSAP